MLFGLCVNCDITVVLGKILPSSEEWCAKQSGSPMTHWKGQEFPVFLLQLNCADIPQATYALGIGSQWGYTHAQATAVTRAVAKSSRCFTEHQGAEGFLHHCMYHIWGKVKRTFPHIVILPEEIQSIMNRMGQLGDTGLHCMIYCWIHKSSWDCRRISPRSSVQTQVVIAPSCWWLPSIVA